MRSAPRHALFALSLFATHTCANTHPRPLLSPEDVNLIRAQLDTASGFAHSLGASGARIDGYFESLPDVPVPVDGGGGYTHENLLRPGCPSGAACRPVGVAPGWRNKTCKSQRNQITKSIN